jgi:hypothetical protein
LRRAVRRAPQGDWRRTPRAGFADPLTGVTRQHGDAGRHRRVGGGYEPPTRRESARRGFEQHLRGILECDPAERSCRERDSLPRPANSRRRRHATRRVDENQLHGFYQPKCAGKSPFGALQCIEPATLVDADQRRQSRRVVRIRPRRKVRVIRGGICLRTRIPHITVGHRILSAAHGTAEDAGDDVAIDRLSRCGDEPRILVRGGAPQSVDQLDVHGANSGR